MIIEQTGLTKKGELKSDHQSWRVDYPLKYEELYHDGYIPITLRKLADSDHP